MLEQKVDERLVAVAPRQRVQQIGVLLTQGRVDEAAWLERERRPVQCLGQRHRHDRTQRATGVFGLTEYTSK